MRDAVKPIGPICLLSRDLIPLHLSRLLVSLCQHPGWVSFCPLAHSRLVINSADRRSLWPKQIQSPVQVEGQGLFVERMCFFLHQVSHILNVAYGVTNLYPDLFVYKTIQILDLPDTDITSYLAESSSFIEAARKQVHYTHSKLVINSILFNTAIRGYLICQSSYTEMQTF